jgi:hypothetical protein
MNNTNIRWSAAWALPLAAAFSAMIAGCAPTPVPANRLARSQAVVDAAEQMRAESDPRAASHLKLAKEQLAYARKLMRDGDNGAAAWVLARAEADGEAALSLAQASTARADAERTLDAIKQMMSAMQTGGSGS